MTKLKSQFGLLYLDELKGAYKSKLMIVLSIGLPLLSLLMQLLIPDSQEISLSFIVSALLGSVGGTLSAVLLSTTISGERNRNVYDLFLIRPVKRWEIILAKYFGIITCLLFAILASILLGLIVDLIRFDIAARDLLNYHLQSLVLSLATVIVACSVGVFFGVLIKSVVLSAVISYYVGNQISSIILLPTLFIPSLLESLAKLVVFSLGTGLGLSALILVTSLIIFQKKSQY